MKVVANIAHWNQGLWLDVNYIDRMPWLYMQSAKGSAHGMKYFYHACKYLVVNKSNFMYTKKLVQRRKGSQYFVDLISYTEQTGNEETMRIYIRPCIV